MTRRELLKLAEESRLDKEFKELYYRPGLDNVSRLFLNSIRENLHHQRRRKQFAEYSGYKPRY